MLKLILTSKPMVAAMIFLGLLIPLSFIAGLIEERHGYHQQAVMEVSDSWTAEQSIIGPLVVIEYAVDTTERHWQEKRDIYVTPEQTTRAFMFLPMEVLNADIDVAAEIRNRGIHRVPVYTSTMHFAGRFEPALARQELEARGATLKSMYLWVWASDQRGFSGLPAVTWAGQPVTWKAGGHEALGGTGIRARLAGDISREAAFSMELTVKGSGALGLVPTGRATVYSMTSDWPHPKFLGRYLPDRREVREDGFAAEWRSTNLATNVTRDLSLCASGNCAGLRANHFGVELIEPVDVYVLSERSVKYGFLFILLVFSGVVLVEIIRRLDIHPIQYALIGAAMAVFYLLLIAIAEHLAFSYAYLIAATMSTALLAYYGMYVLGSRTDGIIFAGVVLSLYGVLFLILQAEDTALLMGALLTFAVLAAMMVATRDTRWLSSFRLIEE